MTGRLYIGTVAARSYVLARSGAADEAFGLLCQVAATEPGKPWAAGWLAMPEASAAAFADGMDPDQAATSLMRLAGSLPDPAGPGLVAPLTPFLQVARRVAACNPEHAGVLPLLSALARRLGAHDEAIAWCQRAEQASRSASAAIMLGYALRSAGRRGEMYEAWRRALSRDNGNVSLRVDIAEHLAADGRAEEGFARLEEGLALEADHPKAFPSACYMRFQLDGDIAHLVRLAGGENIPGMTTPARCYHGLLQAPVARHDAMGQRGGRQRAAPVRADPGAGRAACRQGTSRLVGA